MSKKIMNQIGDLLYKKDISEYDIELIREKIYTITYLSEQRNYKLDVYEGRLEFLSNNYNKAIYWFNRAILNYGLMVPKTAYNGLFKVYLNKGDYQKALKYLVLYNSCFDEDLNISIYFKMIYRLLELQGIMPKYHINIKNQPDYIWSEHIKDSKILRIFRKLETQFDNYDYASCLKSLLKFSEELAKTEYRIDVYSLIKMLNNIIYLTNNKDYINKLINTNLEKLSLMQNNEQKKAFLLEEIKNPFNVYALIELIKIFISEKDFESANRYLNKKMDGKTKEDYITELNILRKMVTEEIGLEKNKDQIVKTITVANEFLSEGNYEHALNTYDLASKDLDLPIYIFKIAEIYYEMSRFDVAESLFKKYLSIAYVYKKECFIYLNYIESLKNNGAPHTKYTDDINKVHSSLYFSQIISKAEEGYIKGLCLLEESKKSEIEILCSNVISSIKKGDIFRVEKINRKKILPEELELIKIIAAPVLLEKGAITLADKYYDSALRFSDNEQIKTLADKYKVLRQTK